ncbi:MAG: DEAD/DEAH box helicase [Sporolactobacillus sp.]
MALIYAETEQSPSKFSVNPELQNFLYGKIYRMEDLPFPPEIINAHRAHGLLTVRPGITALPSSLLSRLISPQKWRCNRCGNEDPRAFGRCTLSGCECVYCRHCLSMGGIIRDRGLLVTWTGPAPIDKQPWGASEQLCTWKGTLSRQQQIAADQLNRALTAGRSFLIWAVTGAGKTELLFPAMAHALLAGKRIALTTPRTDVVKELFPRLRAAFPDVPISALYGGSEERLPAAPLVVATTHQMIHFYHYFDLILIDEVDAFPFHADAMLPFAVARAAKNKTPIAYLTATPPDHLRRAFIKGELDGVLIPGRYHGHPLPLPKMCWIGNWQRAVARNFLPQPFSKWIHEKLSKKIQLFIFVPTLTLTYQLTELLQREGIGRIAGVHADDPDRHAKVTYFRQGELDILVTTTILERGVTIAGAEVAVFGADDPIFDQRALVQIAGRVGRSAARPGGDVLFFHNGRTLQMIKAVRHIERMNREAGHEQQ